MTIDVADLTFDSEDFPGFVIGKPKLATRNDSFGLNYLVEDSDFHFAATAFIDFACFKKVSDEDKVNVMRNYIRDSIRYRCIDIDKAIKETEEFHASKEY